MSISMLSLLLAAGGLHFFQLRMQKKALVQKLTAHAEILGANSVAALRFRVPSDAQKVLDTLRTVPGVTNAEIFDDHNSLFANFPRYAGYHPLASDGISYDSDRIRLTLPIIQDEERIGTISIGWSLHQLYEQTRASFFVLISIFLVTTLVALVLTRSMVRIMTKPVKSLVETARGVSQTGDFSLRAQKFFPDDLGNLTDGFNEMLEQINERDARLRHEQNALNEAREREGALEKQLARSERMESLGILAGGVAHDLNNILGPLVGYPQLMLDAVAPDSPLRHDIEEMQKAANRASHVIQDLLTLGRRGNYDRHPVQLNTLVDEYSNSAGFKSLMNEHPDIVVTRQLDPDLIEVDGSSHHLTQVLMNLVLNAVEAIQTAGTLEIVTREANFSTPYSGYEVIPPGNYVVLEVIDSGPGISEDDRAHIFEPFYTRKAMGRSGSGLGLAVVYGILKDLDGYVDLSCESGESTRFSLYLRPALDDQSVLEESPRDDVRGEESILVVDDELEQRELSRRLLTSLGYHVVTAESGHEGVQTCTQNRFDVVVLDMIMDDSMDGLDTFRAIRKIHPDQKCIIASGFSESNRVRSAQSEGAGAFVQKPYTRERLAGAIRTALAGSA